MKQYKRYQKTCPTCGNHFEALWQRAKFCSRACAGSFRNYKYHGDLFWNYVEKTPTCWLWRGPLKANGYGSESEYRGVKLRAHQRSWVMANGPIPDGMQVLHKCDVKAGVNPDHLYVGDLIDNMRDARERLRHRRGENHYSHQLTEPEVKAIRASRIGCGRLAASYGVSKSTILAVRNRKTWKHVD